MDKYGAEFDLDGDGGKIRFDTVRSSRKFDFEPLLGSSVWCQLDPEDIDVNKCQCFYK